MTPLIILTLSITVSLIALGSLVSIDFKTATSVDEEGNIRPKRWVGQQIPFLLVGLVLNGYCFVQVFEAFDPDTSLKFLLTMSAAFYAVFSLRFFGVKTASVLSRLVQEYALSDAVGAFGKLVDAQSKLSCLSKGVRIVMGLWGSLWAVLLIVAEGTININWTGVAIFNIVVFVAYVGFLIVYTRAEIAHLKESDKNNK